MLVDIVILPPNKIRNIVSRAIIKAVGDFQYVYMADNKNFIPHISFFHVNINKRKLPILLDKVEENLNNYHPTKIFYKNTLVDGKGIWFSLSSHKLLIKFNNLMIKVCAPLRDGLIPWIPKRAPTELEKFNRKTYGTHYCIGQGFKPHFTLVKLKSRLGAKVVYQRIKINKFSFKADTIAVCEINRYGQVTKVLKTFKLS